MRLSPFSGETAPHRRGLRTILESLNLEIFVEREVLARYFSLIRRDAGTFGVHRI